MKQGRPNPKVPDPEPQELQGAVQGWATAQLQNGPVPEPADVAVHSHATPRASLPSDPAPREGSDRGRGGRSGRRTFTRLVTQLSCLHRKTNTDDRGLGRPPSHRPTDCLGRGETAFISG